MKKVSDEKKFILPTTGEELEAVLGEETKKRQKLEFEMRLGKLKKTSDVVMVRRRIAQILTAMNKQKANR